MIVWILIVVIAGVPTGAQYSTRDECESAALKIDATVDGLKIQCLERVKK